MYPIYNGMLMGNPVTLCTDGYSTNGSACTSYANSTCPGGLTDIPTHTNTFAVKSGSCASNYKTFSAEELCTYTPTGSYCVNPCGAGSLYTSVNTCATPCASGATTFNTSTGLAVPLWTTAQTIPALNVGLGEDVCYVNLVPGAAGVGEHAVMVQYGGNTYHTAE